MSFSVLVILVMIALYIPASNTDFYTHHAGLQDLHQGTAGIVHDCIVHTSFQYTQHAGLQDLHQGTADIVHDCIVHTIASNNSTCWTSRPLSRNSRYSS